MAVYSVTVIASSFAAILISNFGYMQMCNADNERVAVYANQTIYLGASFSYFLVFLRDDTKQQQYTRIIEAYNQSLEKDVNQKTEVLRLSLTEGNFTRSYKD